MSTILAHGGAHWAESLVYLAPVILVVGWLAVSSRRAARDQPRPEEEELRATAESDVPEAQSDVSRRAP